MIEFTIKQYIGGNFVKNIDGDLVHIEGDDWSLWVESDLAEADDVMDLMDEGEMGSDDILVNIECRKTGDLMEVWLCDNLKGARWVDADKTMYANAAWDNFTYKVEPSLAYA